MKMCGQNCQYFILFLSLCHLYIIIIWMLRNLNRSVELAPAKILKNLFPSSLNVYKFGMSKYRRVILRSNYGTNILFFMNYLSAQGFAIKVV